MKTKLSYKKTWNFLKKNNHFLIITHDNPDGDGISSLILMAIILKSLKKSYYIIMSGSFPEKYKFLANEYKEYLIPELIIIAKNQKIENMLPTFFHPQAVIILDTCGKDRLEFVPPQYLKNLKNFLNIDHHPGKRKFSGNADLVNPNASATGEIIYHLLKTNHIKITKKMAQLIYIAIVTDTRNFTQSNTNFETHSIIAELLKTKIKPEKIHFKYEEIPFNTLKIYGKVIKRIKLAFNKKLVWSYITNSELTKCIDNDIDGLIEILRQTKNTSCAMIIKEISSKKVKISLRGKEGFNVYKIAKDFKGGGHKQAAGFSYNVSLRKAKKILFKKLKKYFQ